MRYGVLRIITDRQTREWIPVPGRGGAAWRAVSSVRTACGRCAVDRLICMDTYPRGTRNTVLPVSGQERGWADTNDGLFSEKMGAALFYPCVQSTLSKSGALGGVFHSHIILPFSAWLIRCVVIPLALAMGATSRIPGYKQPRDHGSYIKSSC